MTGSSSSDDFMTAVTADLPNPPNLCARAAWWRPGYRSMLTVSDAPALAEQAMGLGSLLVEASPRRFEQT